MSGSTYQIRPNDSLSTIAARYGTTVQVLADTNKLKNPGMIMAGDLLLLPARPDGSEPTARPETAPSRPPVQRNTYTIKNGDTLEAIADKFGANMRELMALNGISNPNRISAGATIKIPNRHGTEDVGRDAAPVPRPLPRPDAPARPHRPQGQEPVSQVAAPGLSARDTEALIRAVAAEARGESPEVWMAVAQAIINYARKNDATIHRLVRTGYLSSNYDGNRRYYHMPLSRIPNLDGIRAAVHGAAQGQSPIGDRSQFHDTSIRTPSYGDRSTAYRIGRMVFYNLK